jgi:hypothetical protein
MVAAAGVVGLTGLSACAAVPEKPDQTKPQLRGGSYSHGSTGGGLKDTLEPYFPVTNPDIARCLQLYEPLLRWNAQYEIEPSVAESVTPTRDNTVWALRLREGVQFHHGTTLTPEDVMFSLAKVTDPQKPGAGGTELAKFLDLKNSKIVDKKTILLQLSAPYAVIDLWPSTPSASCRPTSTSATRSAPARSPTGGSCPASCRSSPASTTSGPGVPRRADHLRLADDAARSTHAGGPVKHRQPAEPRGEHHRSAGRLPVDLETGAWVPSRCGSTLRRSPTCGSARRCG